jgi:NAD-dependent dihydropyrimidine dehydrogenase PreA subunit
LRPLRIFSLRTLRLNVLLFEFKTASKRNIRLFTHNILVNMKDDCKPVSGVIAPTVNLNKCEGKTTCVEVCPYNVFEMQAISDEDYARLNLVGKLKTLVHGKMKAIVKNPEQCHSCGLCVTACPEKAIKLERVIAGGSI